MEERETIILTLKDQHRLLILEQVLSFQLERGVADDNTVRVANQYLQIPPGPWRRSYAQARMMVHLHLDGGVSIWHQQRQLLRTAAQRNRRSCASQRAAN